MQPESLTILSLGFILGLKHALDADHLIAVATIVSERKRLLSSSIVGALWGIGHTAALVVVGFLVIALHVQIPDRIGLAMEFGVAAMLIILGINVLWKVFKGEVVHIHAHDHHGHKHIHPHIHPVTTDHLHPVTPSHHESIRVRFMRRLLKDASQNMRSIFVGVLHGLAGSAALMLIVLSTIASQQLAVLYIVVFGLGSIGGMMLMSTVIGLPFILTASRSFFLQRAVRVVAGLASVGFGVFLGWEVGFVGGLFNLNGFPGK
jgi:high-affinity nickel permease